MWLHKKSLGILLKEVIGHFVCVLLYDNEVNLLMALCRCLPNGLSHVEVTLRLGPADDASVIGSLQTSIKENDGELEMSNGASAKLVSVEILRPGKSPT